MKRVFRLLITSAVLAAVVTACGSSKEGESKVETSKEQVQEEEKKSEETKIVATVLNANLATEADLKSIDLSEELVGQIIEARPFVSIYRS